MRCPYLLLSLLPAVIHGTCVVEVRLCELPFILDESSYVPDIVPCIPDSARPEPDFESSGEYLRYMDDVEYYCNASLGASYVQGVCDYGCFDSESNMPLSYGDGSNNLLMFCKTKASACQFPFIWEGKEYTSCTKDGSNFYWCPVSLNQDKTIRGNRWLKCDMKTCTGDQNVVEQTDEEPEGDDGPTLIHTDNNFKYYKVPVPESSKMTSATILNACTNHGMKPQCPGMTEVNKEWPNSDTNCIRVKDCEKIDGCARVLSNVLCSTSDPRKCPTTLNMFWPMHKWRYGSACGVTTERFCGLNKDYTSTSNKPYFAACIDTIKPKEDMDDLELNVTIDDHDAKIDDIDVKIDQGAKIDDIEKHFNARMDKLEKAMNDQGAKIDGLEKKLDDVIDWIG